MIKFHRILLGKNKETSQIQFGHAESGFFVVLVVKRKVQFVEERAVCSYIKEVSGRTVESEPHIARGYDRFRVDLLDEERMKCHRLLALVCIDATKNTLERLHLFGFCRETISGRFIIVFSQYVI